jgi:hypothetical protein
MTRTRIAIALIAVCAAALLPAMSVLLQLATNDDWYRPGADSMTAFERRYALLRDALSGQTVVDYREPDVGDSTAKLAHFYMTRYALAPVQVLVESDAPLVIADAVKDPSQLPPELTVRQDFGGGLLLLERNAEH